MITDLDRHDLVDRLMRAGISAEILQSLVTKLEDAASSFKMRCRDRAKSHRIAEVIEQLSVIAGVALHASRGREISIPTQIFPETFDALMGRYPFSNLDLARVTRETLEGTENAAPPIRTAVIGATVEPHVVDAAMRQFPGEPHFVAARLRTFPTAAAEGFFSADQCGPDVELRRRQALEDFVRGGLDSAKAKVALAFIEEVSAGVARATLDPDRENAGRRSVYDWAEPHPASRIAFDVCHIMLPRLTHQSKSDQLDIITALVDLLTNTGREAESEYPELDIVREDMISSAMAVCVSLRQHQRVLERLETMLQGKDREALTPRQQRTRTRLLGYVGTISDSAAELLRRGYMGDFEDSSTIYDDRRIGRARATGAPLPSLDFGDIAETSSDCLFLLKVRRVMKFYLE